MTCKYYTWQSALFGGDYYCIKQERVVNSDHYQRYCKNYSYDDCPIYRNDSSSGGCYLTTACVKAKNLPDDCKELTTLRQFRDDWLKKQPEGNKEVLQYYEIAPKIVQKINERVDADDIWAFIYEKLIVPCVCLIDSGQMEKAYELYKNAALKLAGHFLRDTAV